MYFLRKSYLFQCFGLVCWNYFQVVLVYFLFSCLFLLCFVLFCWCAFFRGKGRRGFLFVFWFQFCFICCFGAVLGFCFACGFACLFGVLLGFLFVFWGFWKGCFVLVAFFLYLLIYLFCFKLFQHKIVCSQYLYLFPSMTFQ